MSAEPCLVLRRSDKYAQLASCEGHEGCIGRGRDTEVEGDVTSPRIGAERFDRFRPPPSFSKVLRPPARIAPHLVDRQRKHSDRAPPAEWDQPRDKWLNVVATLPRPRRRPRRRALIVFRR